jgi:hypothetical protein
MTTKHTAGPWGVVGDYIDAREPTGEVKKNDNNSNCTVFGPDAKANAAFIVLAVNSHDSLVDALRAAVERMEYVAEHIPVSNRHEGVSGAMHVLHMAGHLAQHAKAARAALEKARAG